MPRYRTKGGLAPYRFLLKHFQFDIETGSAESPISQENAASVKRAFRIVGTPDPIVRHPQNRS